MAKEMVARRKGCKGVRPRVPHLLVLQAQFWGSSVTAACHTGTSAVVMSVGIPIPAAWRQFKQTASIVDSLCARRSLKQVFLGWKIKVGKFVHVLLFACIANKYLVATIQSQTKLEPLGMIHTNYQPIIDFMKMNK